jgi:hypothetical protein
MLLVQLHLSGQSHQHVIAVLLIDDVQGVQRGRGEKGREQTYREDDLGL